MEKHHKKEYWKWLLGVLISNPAKYHKEYQFFCRWHPEENYKERREYSREKVSGKVEVTGDGIKVTLDQLKGGNIAGHSIINT